MQIDTNLGNYHNNGRAILLEKLPSQNEQAPESNRRRVPLNPSMSRAILSNSLANVLWEVDGNGPQSANSNQSRSDNEDRNEAELNWVRNAYAEND
jgi:hypothetical protein